MTFSGCLQLLLEFLWICHPTPRVVLLTVINMINSWYGQEVLHMRLGEGLWSAMDGTHSMTCLVTRRPVMESLVTARWTLGGLMFTSETLSLVQIWFFQKLLAPSPLHPVEPESRVLPWRLLALSGSFNLQFDFTVLGPHWGKGRPMLERSVVVVTVCLDEGGHSWGLVSGRDGVVRTVKVITKTGGGGTM